MKKKHVYYLAIDPGYTGAVARLRDDGKLVILDLPVIQVMRGGKKRNEYDVPAYLEMIEKLSRGKEIYGVVEDVGPQPVFGAQGNFHLGEGKMLAMVGVGGMPYELVLPTRWKRAVGIPPKSNKSYSLVVAKRLFPKYASSFTRVTKDHGRADAVLMAEWLRRERGGAGKRK